MQIVLSYVFVIIWEHCVSKYWMWLNNNLCSEFFLIFWMTFWLYLESLWSLLSLMMQVCKFCFTVSFVSFLFCFWFFILQICRTWSFTCCFSWTLVPWFMCSQLKGTLYGLRQFLATGSPLKMMKNAFLFYHKKFF